MRNLKGLLAIGLGPSRVPIKMHMGEYIHRTHHPISESPGEAAPTHSPSNHAWLALSSPKRRELTATLKRCNRTEGSDVDLLISNISNDEVRAAAVSLLCRKDYLIRNPITRGRLLESLRPFAQECRVQAYAMLSLRDEFYARSYRVCAPAAHIIEATKADRDPAITYELIDLAARLSPQGKDAAAKIAFILLQDSTLTSGQRNLALFHARVWYVEHRGTQNPWLNVLSKPVHPATLRLLKEIVQGNISDPREYPILRNVISLPLLPHEIALTASIVTVAAQKVAKLLGAQNNLAAPASALAATVLIVGGRYLWRARCIDQVNSYRTPEKLEAIQHLRAVLDSSELSAPSSQPKLKRRVVDILKSANNFLQAPVVQSAARAALADR